MSYKDDIEQIKTEIIGEGKFLEYYIHLERYYKKFKLLIWLFIALLIGLVVYNRYTQYQNEKKVEMITMVYNKVVKNPSEENLNKLKGDSPKLYQLFLLHEGAKKADKTRLEKIKDQQGLIGKIAKYQIASLNNDIKTLSNLRAEEGAVFKEFSVIQTAYGYAKDKKSKEAQEELEKLPFNSQFKTNGDIIGHFGVVK